MTNPKMALACNGECIACLWEGGGKDAPALVATFCKLKRVPASGLCKTCGKPFGRLEAEEATAKWTAALKKEKAQ